MSQLAGIELGGTKTILVRGVPGRIAERIEIPTTLPDETLGQAAGILMDWHRQCPIEALGIASFGPVRLDPAAADFGTILHTPKPGWQGAHLISALRREMECRVSLDTDVNAAALAEHRLGAALGCSNMVYVTIGTGIGGGILVEGRPVHGALHPEVGHVRLRRGSGDDFPGVCPFHSDCAEGLLSGPALAARFRRHPSEVSRDDAAWEPVSRDLAELLALLMLTLSPERIVVGGGVTGKQPHLLPRAIAHVPAILAGYLADCDTVSLGTRIVPAALGDDAGPNGALVLAAEILAPEAVAGTGRHF